MFEMGGIIPGAVNCCPSSSLLCGCSMWIWLLLTWWLTFEGSCPTARVARRKKFNLPILWRHPKSQVPLLHSVGQSILSTATGKLQLSVWEATCIYREGEDCWVHLCRLVTPEVCSPPHTVTPFLVICFAFHIYFFVMFCSSTIKSWDTDLCLFNWLGMQYIIHLHLEDSNF